MLAAPLRLPARLLAFTVAALGLAAAYGTQRYLSLFLTDWPAVLAAGAIECAYIAIAILPSREAGSPEASRTAVALVLASIAFNFGHAYELVAPGALRGPSARFEWLGALQALAAAGFVPWIAYRLARVRAGLLERAADAAERESTRLDEIAPSPEGSFTAVAGDDIEPYAPIAVRDGKAYPMGPKTMSSEDLAEAQGFRGLPPPPAPRVAMPPPPELRQPVIPEIPKAPRLDLVEKVRETIGDETAPGGGEGS